jgi:hypothetical protein
MNYQHSAVPRRTPYVETFDNGPGGWLAWKGPGMNVLPEIQDGVLLSRSPWGVDANHAPPGLGYLHLLTFLITRSELVQDIGRPNRFVDEGYDRDLTNARLSVRLRSEVERRDAELVLLAQADVPGTRANYVLTGQPFQITPTWTEQTITLVPDSDQWACLGARYDLGHFYGCRDIADVLRDVNVDLIFVFFPLQIVPLSPVPDLHRVRPHRDFEPDPRYLPTGEVEIDTIRLDYPVYPIPKRRRARTARSTPDAHDRRG